MTAFIGRISGRGSRLFASFYERLWFPALSKMKGKGYS